MARGWDIGAGNRGANLAPVDARSLHESTQLLPLLLLLSAVAQPPAQCLACRTESCHCEAKHKNSRPGWRPGCAPRAVGAEPCCACTADVRPGRRTANASSWADGREGRYST
eukprot:445993-Rhodomonas_salina.4